MCVCVCVCMYYIHKHGSLPQEKHKEKKRVIENNLLHGALLLLERMFYGSKKFMQLSLKPKNPSLRENTRKGGEKFESVKMCLS